MRRTVSHRSYLNKHLAKPEEAAAYLNAVAEDNDIKTLLKAVRNVVQAQGGMGALAKSVKMSRTSLYKTLSPSGNPEISTLESVLAVYGIRIGFFSIGGDSRHRPPSSRAGYGHSHYLTP